MIYSYNEGQQADEYKARKAAEAEKKEKEEKERDDHRLIAGARRKGGNYGSIGGNRTDKDIKREKKVDSIYDTERNRRVNDARDAWKKHKWSNEYDEAKKHRGNLMDNYSSAHDAINRHIRRHTNESSIFESVEII